MDIFGGEEPKIAFTFLFYSGLEHRADQKKKS